MENSTSKNLDFMGYVKHVTKKYMKPMTTYTMFSRSSPLSQKSAFGTNQDTVILIIDCVLCAECWCEFVDPTCTCPSDIGWLLSAIDSYEYFREILPKNVALITNCVVDSAHE